MFRKYLAICAAALVAATPTSAHAAAPVQGLTCGMVSVGDVASPPLSPQTARVFYGPLTANTSFSATCEFRVGGSGVYTDQGTFHIAPTGVSHTVPLPTGWVTVEEPTLFTYPAGPYDPVWLCTTVVIFSPTTVLYWDAPNHTWSGNPNIAKCALAVSQEVPPAEVCSFAPDVCRITTLPATVRFVLPDLSV